MWKKNSYALIGGIVRFFSSIMYMCVIVCCLSAFIGFHPARHLLVLWWCPRLISAGGGGGQISGSRIFLLPCCNENRAAAALVVRPLRLVEC